MDASAGGNEKLAKIGMVAARGFLIVALATVECLLAYRYGVDVLLSVASYLMSAAWFCFALTEHSILGFAITPGAWGDIAADIVKNRTLKRSVWRMTKVADRAIVTSSFLTLFGSALLYLNSQVSHDLKVTAVPILGGMLTGCMSGYLLVARPE